jgi:cullin 3
VRAVFSGRRHELNVSTYQMCILLMFNSADVVPYSRMAAELTIPEDELKRHLLSLTAPKARVLNRSKKAREIEADETFTVNNEFTSKLVKIKIPLISLKSATAAGGAGGSGGAAAGGGGTGGSGGAASGGAGGLPPREPQEGPDVPELVEESRKHLMEAAIVRIMKTRRTLDHANLVSEVTRQLQARFRPSPQDIKKRIEGLMEREYLERDKDDKKTYHYLA